MVLNCRTQAPQYRIVVMNRAGRNNLIQDITLDVDFQVKKPYLLFRDKKHPENGVHGIWFHEDEERRAISHTLNRLLTGMKDASTSAGASNGTAQPAAKQQPSEAPAGGNGQALLSLLRSAPAPAPVPQGVPINKDALFSSGSLAAPAASEPAAAQPKAASAPPAAAGASLRALINVGANASAPARQEAPKPRAIETAQAQHAQAQAPSRASAGHAASAMLGGVASALGAASASASAAPRALPAPSDMVTVLTRKQLKAVLLDMLDDDAFIRELHAKYIETAMRERDD